MENKNPKCSFGTGTFYFSGVLRTGYFVIYDLTSNFRGQCREFAVNSKSSFCVQCLILFFRYGISYPITS
jgi:hypothetical protein